MESGTNDATECRTAADADVNGHGHGRALDLAASARLCVSTCFCTDWGTIPQLGVSKIEPSFWRETFFTLNSDFGLTMKM